MAKGESSSAGQDQSRISASNLMVLYTDFMKSYSKSTPKRLRIIDAFCTLCFILTLVPLGYSFLVGNFPMNALLSGIFAPLGTLIFTVCLRFQINKETKYSEISDQKAFLEYLFCMVVYYIAIFNFLG